MQYGSHVVLKNLSVHFEANKVHGILGLNGSGKTSLFNSIYGLVQKSGGIINFDVAGSAKEIIAFLESDLFFFSNITAREYLLLFDNKGMLDIDSLSNMLHIPLDEFIENYSHGMKKKLALMSVVLRDKPVLLLDEPFNGLDLNAVETVKQIVGKMRDRNKTVVITSHIIETLYDTCDVIHFLNNGEIQYTYTRENFGEIAETILKQLRETTTDSLNKIFDKKI